MYGTVRHRYVQDVPSRLHSRFAGKGADEGTADEGPSDMQGRAVTIGKGWKVLALLVVGKVGA